MAFIFHFIYGMSSFPLTHIFQRGRAQPPASWYFFCTSIPTGPSSWSCQNMSCRLCVFFRGKMARWKQQIKFTRPLFFCLHHHSYLHYVWSCDNDEPYLSTILILTVIQTHTPSRKDFPGVRAIISSLDDEKLYIYILAFPSWWSNMPVQIRLKCQCTVKIPQFIFDMPPLFPNSLDNQFNIHEYPTVIPILSVMIPSMLLNMGIPIQIPSILEGSSQQYDPWKMRFCGCEPQVCWCFTLW